MSHLLDHWKKIAFDLNSPTIRMRKEDKIDLFESLGGGDLLTAEQRMWGPRMRVIKAMGTPTAGLGFTGPPVPNAEMDQTPAAVTSTSETSLYTLASTGSNTFMWIPAGNFRAPQAWLVWAAGVFTTGAAGQTFTWTTRIGTSTTTASNASLGATGAVNPNAGATITAGTWNYMGLMVVRTPGTSGTAVGSFNITMGTTATATTSVQALAGITAAATLDCTQGAFWSIDTTLSATTASTQITEMLILAAD